MADHPAKRGPFAYVAGGDVPLVRANDCPGFKNCLKEAANKNWSGFTCGGCSDLTGEADVIKQCGPRDLNTVPIDVFFSRIQNTPARRGYTPENFITRIQEEIEGYYGTHSGEYAFIRDEVRLLQGVLDGRDDLGPLIKKSNVARKKFHVPPDLYIVYMKVCRESWSG